MASYPSASPSHPRDDGSGPTAASARPLQSQVQDVASVARERLHGVVAALQTPAVRGNRRVLAAYGYRK